MWRRWSDGRVGEWAVNDSFSNPFVASPTSQFILQPFPWTCCSRLYRPIMACLCCEHWWFWTFVLIINNENVIFLSWINLQFCLQMWVPIKLLVSELRLTNKKNFVLISFIVHRCLGIEFCYICTLFYVPFVFNANPLHYYALRVPRKAHTWRWVWSIFKSRSTGADHITCGTSV